MSSSFSLALALPFRALFTMTAGTATPAAHQACTMELAFAQLRVQVGDTEVQSELVVSYTGFELRLLSRGCKYGCKPECSFSFSEGFE